MRPAQESYTLPEIRDVIADLRRASIDYDTALQEIALMEEAIDAGQRELSRQKVQYRDFDEASPERTRSGLELMQVRLQLELARLELAWLKTESEALEGKVEDLRALTGTAARRLTATEAAIAVVIEATEEAEKTGG